MARKKETPKPLFGLKHDFYASLDHTLQQSILLIQAVEQALDLDQVKEGPAMDLLRERATNLRAALMDE